MYRFVGYWHAPQQAELFGPEHIYDAYVERHRPMRQYGKYIEQRTAGAPLQLIACIEAARMNSSTIIVPTSEDILGRKRFRKLITDAQLPVIALDGVFSSMEQFQIIARDRDRKAKQKAAVQQTTSKRKALNGEKVGNPNISAHAITGTHSASALAEALRKLAAPEIDAIMLEFGPDISCATIALELNRRRVPTLRNGSKWHASSVRRVVESCFPGRINSRK